MLLRCEEVGKVYLTDGYAPVSVSSVVVVVVRVVYEDPDPVHGFMLMLDPKWKSHPNPDMVPKTLWKHDASVQHLCCLAICHDRTITSMRDLRKKHLPMLKAIYVKGREALKVGA